MMVESWGMSKDLCTVQGECEISGAYKKKHVLIWQLACQKATERHVEGYCRRVFAPTLKGSFALANETPLIFSTLYGFYAWFSRSTKISKDKVEVALPQS